MHCEIVVDISSNCTFKSMHIFNCQSVLVYSLGRKACPKLLHLCCLWPLMANTVCKSGATLKIFPADGNHFKINCSLTDIDGDLRSLARGSSRIQLYNSFTTWLIVFFKILYKGLKEKYHAAKSE